jgi:hypothetical protein
MAHRFAVFVIAMLGPFLAAGCNDCTSPDDITLHHLYAEGDSAASGTISFWYVIRGDSLPSSSGTYSLTVHLDSDPLQGIDGGDPAEISIDFRIVQNGLSIDGPDEEDTTPFLTAYGFEPEPDHAVVAVNRLDVPPGTRSMMVELEFPAGGQGDWNRIALVESLEVKAGEVTSAGWIYAFSGDRIDLEKTRRGSFGTGG